MLDGASYTADVTHSLPHPSEAGAGWWCKFVVKGEGSSLVLDEDGDNCLLKVRGAGLATFVDVLILLQIHETAGAAGRPDADADFITVKGEALAGTELEFITDGNKYYVIGSSYDVSADLTVNT